MSAEDSGVNERAPTSARKPAQCAVSAPGTQREDGRIPARLHIALVEPEIPWNAGNVGRTCLALGARLHLIRPLGFLLSSRALRRAGLDYWAQVPLEVWPDWNSAATELARLGEMWFFAPRRGRSLFEAPIGLPAVLVFGSESRGLDAGLLDSNLDRVVQIPTRNSAVRSLNLSTAVAVAGFEVIRRSGSIPF